MRVRDRVERNKERTDGPRRATNHVTRLRLRVKEHAARFNPPARPREYLFIGRGENYRAGRRERRGSVLNDTALCAPISTYERNGR